MPRPAPEARSGASLRPAVRLCRAFAIACALCWAGAAAALTPAAGGAAPAVTADRVLVLSADGNATADAAIQALTAAMRRPGGTPGAPGPSLQPLQLERLNLDSNAEVREMARQRLGEARAYRAVLTTSQQWARTLQQEWPRTPIVFAGIDHPVRNCLVDDLLRPGRNASGYMLFLPQGHLKMLEALHDAYPQLGRVLVLVSGHNLSGLGCADREQALRTPPPCSPGLRGADEITRRSIGADALLAHAAVLGLELQFLVLCEPGQFRLLQRHAAGRADTGLLVPWHDLFSAHRQAVVDAVAQARRPAIYFHSGLVRMGGLMALEPATEPSGLRPVVLMLMQVLQGRDPATLPVWQPLGFQLSFNTGTALAQGLKPSLALLRRADVILP